VKGAGGADRPPRLFIIIGPYIFFVVVNLFLVLIDFGDFLVD